MKKSGALKMISEDDMQSMIDKYFLSFLDDFEKTFQRLPSTLENNIWKMGFVDACEALYETMLLEHAKKMLEEDN